MTATNVRADQRFTRERRCPICGGAPSDMRGKRRRCIGYTSGDGLYVHCSREEHAGPIAITEASQTYAHRATGECACGLVHRDDPNAWRYRRGGQSYDVECVYDYRDELGHLLFQAVRLDPKDFAQRRPDGVGGWHWNLQDTRRVLYRLPELLKADHSQPVYIVEGEKDVETLRSRGLVATCNPMGAKKWGAINECARAALAMRHVAVIADADADGRAHAEQVLGFVSEYAASWKSFELPHAKDITDWFAADGTTEKLEYIRASIPATARGTNGSNGTHANGHDADHTFADRDEEPIAKSPRRKLGRTWDECAEEIRERMHEPWTSIRIGNTDVAECRNGSFIPLIAPSGAGKSSLAIQMLVDHALNRGVAIYMTYELDGDEAVGRGIGQLAQYGWANVLRGDIPVDHIPMTRTHPRLDRIRVLERDDATLENLAQLVIELRKEFAGESILVVVDYMQAKPAPPGKERGYIANVSSELRRAAKTNRVVIVGISQASTDNSKKLRAGDLLGIDSAATGAETSQIERDAYVILTLGDRQPIDMDAVSWKLSVAKNRMGDPDIVHELHYRGRVGHWEVVGEPRKASDVRAEKAEERAKAKKNGGIDPVEAMLKRLINEHKAGRREMCTKSYLRGGNGFGKDKAELALDVLVHDGKARLVAIARMEGPVNKKRSIDREIYEPIQGGQS